MKSLRCGRRKQNNRGMSLVEVIIAIAILGVAIVPLLYMFVYTTQFNARARVRQRATTIAQTIMENYKAYSKEDVDAMFDANAFLSNAGMMMRMAPRLESNGAGGTDTYYEYYLEDIRIENSSYDAMVLMTAHEAEVSLVEYESMDNTQDAIYAADASVDWTAVENVAIAAANALNVPVGTPAPAGEPPESAYLDGRTHSASEIDIEEINIERTIHVTLENTRAVVQYAYHYYGKVSSGGGRCYRYYYDDGSGSTLVPLDDTYISPEIVIFDLSGSIGQLRNVYMFYNPAYKNGPSAGENALFNFESDKIVINNQRTAVDAEGHAIPVNFYLYKQKNLTVSDSWLTIMENNYRVTVQGIGQPINLYDNLSVNIGNNGTANGFQPEVLTTVTRGGASGTDLIQKTEAVPLIYDITVKLYEGGAHAGGQIIWNSDENAIAVLEGTVIE